MPKTCARQFSYVRCIVDDDIETIGRSFPRDPGKKLRVLLLSLIHVDPPFRVIEADWLQIETDNGSIRKIVTPQPQGLTFEDS